MRRWIPVLLAMLLCACATPTQRPVDPATTDASPAPAAPKACDPEPFCYANCLRGYQPGYCRFKCGC